MLTAVRMMNISSREGNVAPTFTVGLVLLIVVGILGFWVLSSNNASANDDGKDSSTQDANFSGSDCEKEPKVAKDVDYGINNPQTNIFAATGGNLIGNGPPLDSSSASAAVKDLYSRTESNPKLTANLAYVMRLSGFTPKDETRDAMKVDVAFLDARVASLVSDTRLWSQTRRNICIRLGETSMDADPYKDRDLTEIATRVQPVEAEGVLLPVTNVVLGRTTQPDGVRLLWVNRDVDDANNGGSGERPNKFPIAVDVQFAWPVIVGEIPESAERPQPPSPEQMQQDQQFQQQNQGGGKDADGGGNGSAGKGGGNTNQHNGQTNGCNAGDNCGKGNDTSGNGSGPGDGGGSGGGGSDCGSGCSGGGGDSGGGGCGSCGGGSTPTTSKPTTTKPPASTTTVPKTTTTKPPATTTTKPPSTTTTKPPAPPTTKAPDIPCDQLMFCD